MWIPKVTSPRTIRRFMVAAWVGLNLMVPGVGTGQDDLSWSQDHEKLAPSAESDPVPLREPSDTEQDRAHALALYGVGRLHFHREEYLAALRAFQRAWRFDPRASDRLWEIYQLADHLEHYDEAHRYALLACERSPRYPVVMFDLATQLADRGDLMRARRLLKAASKIHTARDLLSVGLSFEYIRTHLTESEKPCDTSPLRMVLSAWESPSQFGTSVEELQQITGTREQVAGVVAEVAFVSGHLDEAERAWSLWQESDAPPEPALVEFQRARLDWGRGRPTQAELKLESYLASDSQAAGIAAYDLLRQILHGRLGVEQGGVVFRTRLAQLCRQDPANDLLAVYSASQHLAAGEAGKAVILLEPVVDGGGQDGAESLLIAAHLSQGRVDRLLSLLGQMYHRRGAVR